jgi:hypothetical protein
MVEQMKPLEESAAARSDDATCRVHPKPEPGIRLARVVRCFGLARGNRDDACQIAKALYADRDPDVFEFLKAITGQLGSIGNWLLWGTETTVLADFVEHVNQRTLVGRAEAVRVPFRVPVINQGSTETVTLEPRRIPVLVTTTEDLLRDSSPTAERYVRDQMVQAW